MTVKLVTLKTNHTIICGYDYSDNDVFLTNPVQVVVQPSKDGPMMGFAPFLDFCEEFSSGIKISSDNVLCVTTPTRDLENQYNKMFGSGIEIASAMPNS
jgi:hypothetical protein